VQCSVWEIEINVGFAPLWDQGQAGQSSEIHATAFQEPCVHSPLYGSLQLKLPLQSGIPRYRHSEIFIVHGLNGPYDKHIG
jgi:hypothetical protein